MTQANPGFYRADISKDQAAAVLATLTDGQAKRVLRRTVNKVGQSSRTEFSKITRDELAVTAKAVKGVTQLRRAVGTELTARLRITRRPIPLKEYKARQTRKGVTVKVRKGEPREKHPHKFIVQKLGHHVFTRKRDGGKRVTRLPIKKEYGPTPLGVLTGKPGMLDDYTDFIDQRTVKVLKQEAHYELVVRPQQKRAKVAKR